MWYNRQYGRFIVKEHSDVCSIFVDKETGVNYLFVQLGYAGGLTVMVDADGKPVVTPVTEE